MHQPELQEQEGLQLHKNEGQLSHHKGSKVTVLFPWYNNPYESWRIIWCKICQDSCGCIQDWSSSRDSHYGCGCILSHLGTSFSAGPCLKAGSFAWDPTCRQVRLLTCQFCRHLIWMIWALILLNWTACLLPSGRTLTVWNGPFWREKVVWRWNEWRWSCFWFASSLLLQRLCRQTSTLVELLMAR